MHVQSVITGRRASQGAARAALQPLEVDGAGLLKLNPLFAWSLADVQAYLDAHDVPRNALLAQGYKSVGDWHSTQKSGEGDAGERAGRWAGREDKTECGLHVDYFKMKAAIKKKVSSPFAVGRNTSLSSLSPHLSSRIVHRACWHLVSVCNCRSSLTSPCSSCSTTARRGGTAARVGEYYGVRRYKWRKVRARR